MECSIYNYVHFSINICHMAIRPDMKTNIKISIKTCTKSSVKTCTKFGIKTSVGIDEIVN